MFQFSDRRRLLFLSALLFAAACAYAGQRYTAAQYSPGVKRLAAANTDFGFRLLHRLTAEQPAGNVFFSPFSISQALLLTLNGAGGQTKQDMAQTLGLGTMPLDQVNAANALLLPSLTHADPKVEVSIANALWANRGITFNSTYEAQSRRFYAAQVSTLDFSSPTAVEAINGWVSENTQGRITQIVSPADIARASVVLTNAVYFHGKWQSPFNKDATQDQPFFLTGGQTKSMPLMSQEDTFAYLDTPQFQAVSLPYGAGRMSLYVVLPKPGSSLGAIVSGMNSRSASQWMGAMKPTRMTIFLPRFKADYEANLNAPLKAIGMASAFELQADFRPMGLPGGFISAVVHKAVLEVDEQGTVAAATTGVAVTAMAMPVQPTIVMRVDHPFFCAIRDNLTGAILFEGVIRDPQ